jgi:hypothetical protein
VTVSKRKVFRVVPASADLLVAGISLDVRVFMYNASLILIAAVNSQLPWAKLVRNRHVFYVEGYDPQGAEGYYRLFRREWARFRKLWPLKTRLGDLKLDSTDIAHWTIETSGPYWQVSTYYEFLRLEEFIGGNMAQPLGRQLFRAARWMVGDLLSGTLARTFRASWWFAVHLLYSQTMIILWLALVVAAGVIAGVLLSSLAGMSPTAAAMIGAAVALLLLVASRPVAERSFALQIANCWPYVREFARGKQSGYSRSIALLAERVVAAARANEADEILIVGHSAGGGIAPVVVARAYEIDPELGLHGPTIVLLTLGSLLPAFALDREAQWLRGIIRKLVLEPSLLWVDCQSRKDWMNFWHFDLFGEIGVDRNKVRCDLRHWQVRFRDMLSEDTYARLQWNLFRMHYQFIMANDKRAPYDYFMLVCGPARIADWASDANKTLAVFAEGDQLADKYEQGLSERSLCSSSVSLADAPTAGVAPQRDDKGL